MPTLIARNPNTGSAATPKVAPKVVVQPNQPQNQPPATSPVLSPKPTYTFEDRRPGESELDFNVRIVRQQQEFRERRDDWERKDRSRRHAERRSFGTERRDVQHRGAKDAVLENRAKLVEWVRKTAGDRAAQEFRDRMNRKLWSANRGDREEAIQYARDSLARQTGNADLIGTDIADLEDGDALSEAAGLVGLYQTLSPEEREAIDLRGLDQQQLIERVNARRKREATDRTLANILSGSAYETEVSPERLAYLTEQLGGQTFGSPEDVLAAERAASAEFNRLAVIAQEKADLADAVDALTSGRIFDGGNPEFLSWASGQVGDQEYGSIAEVNAAANRLAAEWTARQEARAAPTPFQARTFDAGPDPFAHTFERPVDAPLDFGERIPVTARWVERPSGLVGPAGEDERGLEFGELGITDTFRQSPALSWTDRSPDEAAEIGPTGGAEIASGVQNLTPEQRRTFAHLVGQYGYREGMERFNNAQLVGVQAAASMDDITDQLATGNRWKPPTIEEMRALAAPAQDWTQTSGQELGELESNIAAQVESAGDAADKVYQTAVSNFRNPESWRQSATALAVYETELERRLADLTGNRGRSSQSPEEVTAQLERDMAEEWKRYNEAIADSPELADARRESQNRKVQHYIHRWNQFGEVPPLATGIGAGVRLEDMTADQAAQLLAGHPAAEWIAGGLAGAGDRQLSEAEIEEFSRSLDRGMIKRIADAVAKSEGGGPIGFENLDLSDFSVESGNVEVEDPGWIRQTWQTGTKYVPYLSPTVRAAELGYGVVLGLGSAAILAPEYGSAQIQAQLAAQDNAEEWNRQGFGQYLLEIADPRQYGVGDIIQEEAPIVSTVDAIQDFQYVNNPVSKLFLAADATPFIGSVIPSVGLNIPRPNILGRLGLGQNPAYGQGWADLSGEAAMLQDFLANQLVVDHVGNIQAINPSAATIAGLPYGALVDQSGNLIGGLAGSPSIVAPQQGAGGLVYGIRPQAGTRGYRGQPGEGGGLALVPDQQQDAAPQQPEAEAQPVQPDDGRIIRFVPSPGGGASGGGDAAGLVVPFGAPDAGQQSGASASVEGVQQAGQQAGQAPAPVRVLSFPETTTESAPATEGALALDTAPAVESATQLAPAPTQQFAPAPAPAPALAPPTVAYAPVIQQASAAIPSPQIYPTPEEFQQSVQAQTPQAQSQAAQAVGSAQARPQEAEQLAPDDPTPEAPDLTAPDLTAPELTPPEITTPPAPENVAPQVSTPETQPVTTIAQQPTLTSPYAVAPAVAPWTGAQQVSQQVGLPEPMHRPETSPGEAVVPEVGPESGPHGGPVEQLDPAERLRERARPRERVRTRQRNRRKRRIRLSLPDANVQEALRRQLPMQWARVVRWDDGTDSHTLDLVTGDYDFVPDPTPDTNRFEVLERSPIQPYDWEIEINGKLALVGTSNVDYLPNPAGQMGGR